jgi:hypothetical protein
VEEILYDHQTENMQVCVGSLLATTQSRSRNESLASDKKNNYRKYEIIMKNIFATLIIFVIIKDLTLYFVALILDNLDPSS